ncbi:hypothetical protein BDQ17DRAFT_1428852 [Cyathus striatus]|nr:hypothetical protein BDQ17DRAFT_1428852 [Cyathus striatus]
MQKSSYEGPKTWKRVPKTNRVIPRSVETWNSKETDIDKSNCFGLTSGRETIRQTLRLDTSKFTHYNFNGLRDHVYVTTSKGNIELNIKVLNQTGLLQFDKVAKLKAMTNEGNINIKLWDSDDPTTSTSIRPFLDCFVLSDRGEARVYIPRSFKGCISASCNYIYYSGDVFEQVKGQKADEGNLEVQIGDINSTDNRWNCDNLTVRARTVMIQYVEETIDRWEEYRLIIGNING